MSYCAYCGNEIPENGICDCEEAVAEQNKRAATNNEEYTPEKNADYGAVFKKHKIPIIASVLGVILFLMLVAVFSNAAKIDAFDYVNVSFEGYNTAGAATVDFSRDDMIYQIIGEEPEEFADMAEWYQKYEVYYDNIDLEYSPQEGLSNGDEVTVSVIVYDIAANKINGGTKTFVVEGLTEVEVVDVFKDVSVSYKGVSGDGKPVIELKAENDFLQACNLQFDSAAGLSNGDKITLSITNADSLAENHNKIPAEMTKEYEVSGLGAYVIKEDQLPKDLIVSLIKTYIEEEEKDSEPDFMFSYSPVQYYSTYFMCKKDGAFSAYENELHIFVRQDTFKKGELFQTTYSPLVFRNIVINADGTVDLEYEEGSASSFTTDMDNYLSKRSKNFTIEEIKGIAVE